MIIKKIYTDGGNNMKKSRGAWAFAVVDDKGEIIHYNSCLEENTTNNKMELSAVINSINFLIEKNYKDSVEIITDSEYVKKGITDWIKNWKKNGWITANGKSVKNKELWLKLDEIYDEKNHILKWTKGHDGEKYNDFVDNLCTKKILNISET